MKLETLYLKNNSRFANLLTSWANDRNYTIEEFSDKNEDPDTGIDGLVIFNQNQILDKDIAEIRELFDHKQKPVHKIDINGTLMVGISNLDLWIERNRCKKVLFVGSDTLIDNPNLERYLENFK
ncbi:MAG: hypothetical protein ACK46O_00395 [Flavobacteriia bacterium]|jgi:hypothetical protein